MRKWRIRKIAVLAAGWMAVLDTFTPLQAWAASPPFAYTEEEWAAIRDNKLEFTEIDKRIHEYNTTVRQNEISYKDYQGKDSSEITQEYYDAAEEIYDSQPDLDPDSASYASDLASYISNEQRAESLKESGDASVEDEDTIKWGYTQAEKKLVSQAQSLMISYWSSVEKLSSLEQELLEAERKEELTKRKLAAGMAVQSEVLTAEQTGLNVRSEITSAESSLNETKTSLILMLGWNEGDSVEIGNLPEPDTAAIAAISLETDIEQALENNYDLKILSRQLQNAHSSTTEASVREKLTSGRQAVRSNVTAAYQNLLLAEKQYEQAVKAQSLQSQSLETAKRKQEAGLISSSSLESAVSACETAESSKQTAAYQLLSAKLEYDWAVAGLAAVS